MTKTAGQNTQNPAYGFDPKLKFNPAIFKYPQLDNNAWLADPSFKIDPKVFLNNKFSAIANDSYAYTPEYSGGVKPTSLPPSGSTSAVDVAQIGQLSDILFQKTKEQQPYWDERRQQINQENLTYNQQALEAYGATMDKFANLASQRSFGFLTNYMTALQNSPFGKSQLATAAQERMTQASYGKYLGDIGTAAMMDSATKSWPGFTGQTLRGAA